MLFYKKIGPEEDVFHKAYDLGLALLLKGPTGCGKSRFVEHMAEKLIVQLLLEILEILHLVQYLRNLLLFYFRVHHI
jgi:MoxR-like ATPase